VTPEHAAPRVHGPDAAPADRVITIIAREVRGDGGMERAMMQTIERLLDEGWSVHLIAQVCRMESHPRLHWIRVPTPRRPFSLGFPLFVIVAGLMLALRAPRQGKVVSLGAIVPNRVDVVTVQFCQAAFARQHIRRSSRDSLPYLANMWISRALALTLERWCYRPSRVKRMTAVSDLVRDELRRSYGLTEVPIDIVPNGVDIDRFRPDAATRARERQRLDIEQDELVALFAGGDWRRKGLDVAIEATARARWTLVVVGRGDEASWGEVAKEAGADVRFCGHRSDPEAIFNVADAFVFPSRYEGFALVTIEASASGLPLLVTTATGAGRLAEAAGMKPLARDPAVFAAELEGLASDPEGRREIARRARVAAEELAWPRVAAQYVELYANDDVPIRS
jgi:UDP-glucose:(heptosyl)LPS alpha-1,3-glucosyltransferase